MNRIVLDLEISQILIKYLAFENANLECKMVIRPLKARPAPIGEWIGITSDSGSHIYYAIL